jgi:hypothetical protein
MRRGNRMATHCGVVNAIRPSATARPRHVPWCYRWRYAVEELGRPVPRNGLRRRAVQAPDTLASLSAMARRNVLDADQRSHVRSLPGPFTAEPQGGNRVVDPNGSCQPHELARWLVEQRIA